MEELTIKRALVSVTDKTDITEFCSFLHQKDVELISTGGTLEQLSRAGLPVRPVSQVTGFPEILSGRVKTLHPHIHAGILADKDNPDHLQTLQRMQILAFDLVCVNLYDFSLAIAQEQSIAKAIEKIDIGGPTLLRAAAKNFHSLCIAHSPQCYPQIRQELKGGGHIGLALRQRFAAETFDLVSRYDAMIADYLRPNQG